MTETFDQIDISLPVGKNVTFQIPPARGDIAFFALGVRKCGSSIFYSMVQDLARVNGVSFVDVGGVFFDANVREINWRFAPEILQMLRPGAIYGGFRSMPVVFAQSDLFRRSPRVLLVRDPRDALVSEYFSNAYSHHLPEAEGADQGARDNLVKLREAALASSLKRYVLERARFMNKSLTEYAEVSESALTRVFRYEDVIFNKRQLMRDVAAHFGWTDCSEIFLDHMMAWADKRPAEEVPTEFVRRVRPGDHAEKLDAETIRELNSILAPAMHLFGYGA